MSVYTSYFDSHFLVRGAACIRSIIQHTSEPVDIYVLALDNDVERLLPDYVGSLPSGSSLCLETLQNLEARFPELLEAKGSRSRVEYYFTLTPFLCAAALERAGEGGHAVYFDADLFFFADPKLAIDEMGAADIAITEHRFAPSRAYLARDYGRFNVGWLAFRNAPDAHRCIEGWKADCLSSASLAEGGKGFGDQKYLDAWPDHFPTLRIIAHPGVNAAPWNAPSHRFDGVPAGPRVDGKPLVVFHFHRLNRIADGVFQTDYGDYGRLSETLCRTVYLPYVAALRSIEEVHRASLPEGALERSARLVVPDWTPRGLIRYVISVWRLLVRRRVIFRKGVIVNRLEGLFYV